MSSPAAEHYGPKWARPPFERGTDGPRVLLAGIDGSDTSMRALAYAGGLARRQRSELVVLHVVPRSHYAWMIPEAVALLQRTADDLEADLRRHVRLLAEQSQIPVSFVSRRGDPYALLRELADEVQADMVVVGASARASHRLVGSVAARLIRLGRWPITVVP